MSTLGCVGRQALVTPYALHGIEDKKMKKKLRNVEIYFALALTKTSRGFFKNALNQVNRYIVAYIAFLFK